MLPLAMLLWIPRLAQYKASYPCGFDVDASRSCQGCIGAEFWADWLADPLPSKAQPTPCVSHVQSKASAGTNEHMGMIVWQEVARESLALPDVQYRAVQFVLSCGSPDFAAQCKFVAQVKLMKQKISSHITC